MQLRTVVNDSIATKRPSTNRWTTVQHLWMMKLMIYVELCISHTTMVLHWLLVSTFVYSLDASVSFFIFVFCLHSLTAFNIEINIWFEWRIRCVTITWNAAANRKQQLFKKVARTLIRWIEWWCGSQNGTTHTILAFFSSFL